MVCAQAFCNIFIIAMHGVLQVTKINEQVVIYYQTITPLYTIDTPYNSSTPFIARNNSLYFMQEHIYHVLENQKDPMFHKLESPITEQPPLYQEVGQILTSRAGESTTSSAPNEYACIR